MTMNQQYVKLAIPIFVIGIAVTSLLAAFDGSAFAKSCSCHRSSTSTQTSMTSNQTSTAIANQTSTASSPTV